MNDIQNKIKEIIFVEDQPIHYDLFEKIKQELGLPGYWARSVDTFLSYLDLNNDKFVLVLLDISLADDTGLEGFHILKFFKYINELYIYLRSRLLSYSHEQQQDLPRSEIEPTIVRIKNVIFIVNRLITNEFADVLKNSANLKKIKSILDKTLYLVQHFDYTAEQAKQIVEQLNNFYSLTFYKFYIFSAHDNLDYIRKAKFLGADGFISKNYVEGGEMVAQFLKRNFNSEKFVILADTERLINSCIDIVTPNNLDELEFYVLNLKAKGLTYEEIVEKLKEKKQEFPQLADKTIDKNTVEAIRDQIAAKLGIVRQRKDRHLFEKIIIEAFRRGIISKLSLEITE